MSTFSRVCEQIAAWRSFWLSESKDVCPWEAPPQPNYKLHLLRSFRSEKRQGNFMQVFGLGPASPFRLDPKSNWPCKTYTQTGGHAGANLAVVARVTVRPGCTWAKHLALNVRKFAAGTHYHQIRIMHPLTRYSQAFLLLFSICSLPLHGQRRQAKVMRPAPSINWSAINFAHSGTGVVGGQRGCFGYTLDGGQSWRIDSILLLPTPRPEIAAIRLFGFDTVVAVAGANLLTSVNAGLTWQVQAVPFRTARLRARIVSQAKIYITSQSNTGALFRTRDGGLTWDSLKVKPRSQADFYGVHDNGRGRIVAAGGSFMGGNRFSSIYKSLDDGFTWDSCSVDLSRALPDFGQFLGVDFGSDSVGYAVGSKNIIHQTRNGGISWELLTQSDNSQPYLRTVFARGDTVFAMGDAGYSRSGFASRRQATDLTPFFADWMQALPTGSGNRITGVWFGQGVGYANSNGSAILKFSSRSLGWIPVANRSIISAQPTAVYPNPATAGGWMQVTGQGPAAVRLIDAQGRTFGTNYLTLPNTLALPGVPGLYRLSIEQNGQRVCKALVVL